MKKILLSDNDGYLCFRHAVERASSGVDVDIDLDEDYGSEYDMRGHICRMCVGEGARHRAVRIEELSGR